MNKWSILGGILLFVWFALCFTPSILLSTDYGDVYFARYPWAYAISILGIFPIILLLVFIVGSPIYGMMGKEFSFFGTNAGPFIVALAILLVFTLWGKDSLLPQTGWVKVSNKGFDQQEITIEQDEELHLYNVDGHVTQRFCLGKDGDCQSAGRVRVSVLAFPGTVVRPGLTFPVKFADPGIYEITDEAVPHMNLIVQVEEDNDDD